MFDQLAHRRSTSPLSFCSSMTRARTRAQKRGATPAALAAESSRSSVAASCQADPICKGEIG